VKKKQYMFEIHTHVALLTYRTH